MEEIINFILNSDSFILFKWEFNELPRKITQGNLTLLNTKNTKTFNVNKDDFLLVWNILRNSELVLIGWDCKDFFSNLKLITELNGWNWNLTIPNNFIDLFYLRRIEGKDCSFPQSYKEIDLKSKFRGLVKDLHVPLATKVLPVLENNPIGYLGKVVYPYYRIEDQVSGRLNCKVLGDDNYNPHVMDDEFKCNILPIGFDKYFVYCDYKAAEINLLAYLSQDKNLLEDVLSEDPYLAVGKRLVKNGLDRSFVKSFLVPVFYGMTSYGLSQQLNISEVGAEKLMKEIFKNYHIAIDYLKGKSDYFGKEAKNASFLIQSPAAIFCQEHLIWLSSANFNVNASVHDGFLITVDSIGLKDSLKNIKNILEMPSELIPGLVVKSKVIFGRNFSQMENYD